MKKNPNQPADAAELRRCAEERLQTRQQIPQSAVRNPQSTSRVVHELEVHQIEMEMQNEELQQAHARTEALLAQYTELYDFAPAGYFTLAPDSKIRLANLAGASLLGIERARLLNQRFVGFVAAKARSEFGALLARALETKAPQSGEVALSIAGKPRLTVLLQASVTGEDQECRVVMTDLTERTAADDAFHLAQQRLSLNVDQTPLAVIEFDVEGRVREWNPAAIAVFGYSREEAIGQHWKFIVPAALHAQVDGVWASIVGQRGGKRSTNDNITKDGRTISCEWFNMPLIARDGRTIGVASLIEDITERIQAKAALRESEERLGFALQRSYTGGWDLDLVDHTAHRTLEHDRIFGYSSLLPQWTYKMFLEHVLPEDRAEVDRLFREAIAAQTDWGFECRIRRADGEVRWIWAAGGHQRDGQAKARRMAGIVQDVTERKRMEAALRTLNDELEQRVRERTVQLEAANQELEAFSYSVSHDLRAPLRHVHGYVEMLAQETGGQLSETGRRYLKTIIDASKEMGELIDDLLAFSRMGRVEMREASVDLEALVQKTLVTWKPLPRAATSIGRSRRCPRSKPILRCSSRSWPTCWATR